MADILSYISKKIENGISFDNLVGNLLSYKPEIWGYTEQNYETIGSEFGVESNSLYYLPVGNYKLTNLPNSPLATDFVNISVYEQNGKKLITCDAGGNDKYITELTSVTSPVVWSDISDIDNAGNNIIPFSIGNNPPTNTTMIWIDTSKLKSDSMILLKYYNGTSWVSYNVANSMLKSIYDTNNLSEDIYSQVAIAIDQFLDSRLAEFYEHYTDSDIHITDKEREIFNNLISSNSIPVIFAEDGELYTELLNILQNKINTELDYSISEQIISESADKIDEHISTHITPEMIAEWDSKAPGEHSHHLDNRVNVTVDNISGSVDKWVSTTMGVMKWQTICYGNGKFVAIPFNNTGVNSFYYSIDGISWNIASVSMTFRLWKTICYGNGKFIALSNDSILAYSIDGITWTEVLMTNIPRNWYSICYGNGKYIAIAYNSNTFAYSVDGIIWLEINISPSANYWVSVCYGNGKFIAITSTENIFGYSTDGISWILGSISNSNNSWTTVCYGNGKFIAVGMNGNIAYSTTGVTWVEIPIINDNRNWITICHGNDKFVILDYGTNICAYSTDGITWTEDSVEVFGDWVSIAYGNAKFVAVSNNYIFTKLGIVIFPYDKFSTEVSERIYQISSFEILATSSEVSDLLDSKYHNGNTLYVEDESGAATWKKIVDNSKFGTPNYEEGLKDFSLIATSNEYSSILNTPNTLYGYNISDAVSKNDIEIAKEITHYVYTPSEYNIDAIGDSDVYVGIQKTLSNDGGGTTDYPMSTDTAELDVILAVDAKTKSAYIPTHKCNCQSTNYRYFSETWNESSISDDSIIFNDICYGDDKFVAVGNNDKIAYSTDGVEWSIINVFNTYYLTNTWMVVCYGGGKFIAIGKYDDDYSDEYVFAYSTNGITWTIGYIDNHAYLFSICYGNGLYVVVGEDVGGIILYSTDGLNWQVTYNSDVFGFNSVCYGDDKFIAVGSGYNYDAFAYSTDGISWTSGFISNNSIPGYWKSVCYGDGKFIAVGFDNSLAYSTDGFNWTQFIVDIEPIDWYSTCYGNDRFLIISNHRYAYSTDGINWIDGIISVNGTNVKSSCHGNDRFIAICGNKYSELIDYVKIPCCKATGLSIIPCECSADKYFSNIYLSDNENPKWNTDGLGRMIKIDKSCENIVIDKKYSINNHDYNVKIMWKPDIGIVFDVGVVEAVETCQLIHDNFTEKLQGVQASIELYNKRFIEEALI